MTRPRHHRHHRHRRTTGRALSLALLGAIALATAGCSEADLPEADSLVYLSPWSGRDLQAEPARASSPALLSEAERANYREIADSFVQNAPSLLTRADVVQRLESIEQVFLLTGRYMELVALYQDAVEAGGALSPAAPALAWSYVQLGQEAQARELIDQLKTTRGNEAVVHVLDASLNLAQMERDSSAAARALASFQRARQLDPAFGPFRGLNAAGIAEQINRLEARQARTTGATQNAVSSANTENTAQNNAEAQPPVAQNQVAQNQPAAEQSSGEDTQPPVAQSPVAQNELPTAQPPAAQNPLAVGQPPTAQNSAVLQPSAPGPQQQAAIMVADGQITMARGEAHFEEAQRYFRRALEFEPNNIAAGLGLLQIASRSGAPDEMVRSQIELLNRQPDLNARQAYELAMIALRRLNDRPLATSLLQKVQDLDPRYAERVGVDALLTP
ncbi:hypothetical protein FRC96_06920 [Lujinxingia vulgaris]|uniref:Tetratricopeptide repeat protein n=1 Tax=Lujinxingia vulgaris TaxID=2600176 RepID=A0A5C6XJ45_9DELT|nr:hypothetical protein [Lujinxingia vulgaris]TXD39583.1 hypothetical protein FRC96_06920 [Lujinxingia vulgaris]